MNPEKKRTFLVRNYRVTKSVLLIVLHYSGGGGVGDSFANITLAISCRCFLVVTFS